MVKINSPRCKYLPPQLKSQRGSITAEFVVLFPAFLLLVALLCWLGAAQAQRLAVVRAASQLTRLAAIEPAKVPAMASQLNVVAKVQKTGYLVCVTANAKSTSRWLGSVPLQQRFCSRSEGK
jgi:Flp pilus assembly protein TadG